MYTGLSSYVWVFFDMYWSLLTWHLRTRRERIGHGGLIYGSLFKYVGLFSYVCASFQLYRSLLTWYLRTRREMIGPGVSFIGLF